MCPTQCPMSAWLSRLAGGNRHHSVLCEGGHSHLKSFSPQSWVVSSDACGDRSTVSLPWMLGLPAALSSSPTLPCKLSCFDLPDPQLRCLYLWRPGPPSVGPFPVSQPGNFLKAVNYGTLRAHSVSQLLVQRPFTS